jgi:acetylornithine deacetylase/succinyl-diaminopimelate desuccinylase-like protein
VLTVDIRFTPKTTAAAVLEEVRAIVAKIAKGQKFSVTVEPQESVVKNPRSPMDWIVHPIRDEVAAAHEVFSGKPAVAACHPAWPDTPVLNERGIPSITYGPGSKYCYWDEEFVPIPEYLQAIKVYSAIAAQWFTR